MGHVTLYIATSVDGYLADEDGGVDWLDQFGSESEGSEATGGFSEFLESVDCLVMGATTYQQVLGFGEWPYGETPTYVFTHRELSPATEAVEFVDRDVAAVAGELERKHDHVWLVGGAQLAQSFLRAGEIDHLRLFLAPILLGDGIRLFDGDYDRQRLRLLDTASDDSGIVEQRYEFLD
ncbi:Dihydrofolate reductase [Halogeometricum rufum]|uniref:Dihydrofolate reductase n=1 Tax=Halogeometricum rufum TaxID=553469 RepID=A0A1I6HR01_9EURY|nr:dihydrofolate reductase family protein [Halogeometricum rufum]SFR56921.1 Dihydrofolate reductase [Halogeometricum rufum]